jgi:Pyrroline-5-carboxylate reductase dimerisation
VDLEISRDTPDFRSHNRRHLVRVNEQLAEAMIDCAVHMGFARDRATTLVYHTMLGSTLYAMETKQHPAILRNSVTSPSGTTASAIYELESGKFRTVIKDAMWACYRRSLEMGNHDSNVGPGRTPLRHPIASGSAAEDGEGDEENEDESTSPLNEKDERQYRETQYRERVVRR